MNCLCLGFWVGGTVMKLELGIGLVLLGCLVVGFETGYGFKLSGSKIGMVLDSGLGLA